MIRVSGKAVIKHSETGQIYEIESGSLYFDVVEQHERSAGVEKAHCAVFEHPQLGELTWSLWEYPEGVQSLRETEVGPHELIENIDFRLDSRHF